MLAHLTRVVLEKEKGSRLLRMPSGLLDIHETFGSEEDDGSRFIPGNIKFKSMKRFKSGRTFEQRTAYNPNETDKNWDLYDDMRKGE